MSWGGKRDKAGRKPTGRNRVQITLRTSIEAVEEINTLIPTDESLPKKAEKIFLIGLETLRNKDAK